MYNETELLLLLEKWKNLLRLKDWDIKLELVNNEWHKTGDIKIDDDDKKAILLIIHSNPPPYYFLIPNF